jgi:phosphohistidine phosphatase
MNLYLIQHAQAFPKEQYADRPLTEEGYWQAQQTAEFLRRLNVSVRAVWHSGKTRALQTAKLFHAALKEPAPLLKHDGLSPEDDPEPIAEQIEKTGIDLMIVGHLPFLSRLAGLLLCGSPETEPIVFDKACIVCLQRSENGLWQVNWMVKPDIL